MRRLCLLTQALSKTLEHAPPEEKKGETRFCHFHQREGHTLSECKALSDKTLEERSDFILKSGLCFKCLSENCRAVSCKAHIICSICGDKRHIALLHKDKNVKAAESVGSKCTAICSGEGGGLSCSKIILVDVYSKHAPNSTKRVYAILDDQSNASLISSELADELGAGGPDEKLLSLNLQRQERGEVWTPHEQHTGALPERLHHRAADPRRVRKYSIRQTRNPNTRDGEEVPTSVQLGQWDSALGWPGRCTLTHW